MSIVYGGTDRVVDILVLVESYSLRLCFLLNHVVELSGDHHESWRVIEPAHEMAELGNHVQESDAAGSHEEGQHLAVLMLVDVHIDEDHGDHCHALQQMQTYLQFHILLHSLQTIVERDVDLGVRYSRLHSHTQI